MISISFEMLLISVTVSLLIGAVFGTVYSILKALFFLIIKLFERLFSAKAIKVKNCALIQNIFDCVYIFISGIGYCAISYILLDGVIDIYSILLFSAAFVVASKVIALVLGLKKSR